MAESMSGPHLPYDVLTDVRFWMQAIRESKRTIICPPELEVAVRERIASMDLQSRFDVQASPVCPENRILIIDQSALSTTYEKGLP